jgi:hypothetical protein
MRHYGQNPIVTPKQVEMDVLQMVGSGSATDIQRGECMLRLPEVVNNLNSFIHYSNKVVSRQEKDSYRSEAANMCYRLIPVVKNFRDFHVIAKLIEVALHYRYYQKNFWEAIEDTIIYSLPSSGSHFKMNDYSVEQYLKSMFVLEANGKHAYSAESVNNIIEHFLVCAEEFTQIDMTKYTNKQEF